MLQYLPDEKFTGPMQIMRGHLLQMHSSWTWLILGVAALLWGAVSMIISSVMWFGRQSKKKAGMPQ